MMIYNNNSSFLTTMLEVQVDLITFNIFFYVSLSDQPVCNKCTQRKVTIACKKLNQLNQCNQSSRVYDDNTLIHLI